MKCKICSSDCNEAFSHIVLSKYDVKYFKCSSCDYLFTENPFWLEEAYKNPINLSDTGILKRNIFYSKLTSILLYLWFDKSAKFLDYAGGYGIFTRLMRDIGFDYYWHDDFTENLLSKGFEMKDDKYELLTAFEVFEHFDNPVEEMKKMLAKSDNILFSTITIPNSIPSTDWWYYGFEHGQHISFYSTKTFEKMAAILGLKYSNLGFLHLFSKTKKIKINPFLMKLITFSGLDLIVRLVMKSRKDSDHLLLKNKMCK